MLAKIMIRLSLIYFCIIFIHPSPTVLPTNIYLQGITSDTFATQTNATITAFQSIYVVPYLITFVNKPVVVLSLVDYNDDSTGQALTFGVYITQITLTYMAYSFYYVTFSKEYFVSFRSRYIMWDSQVFTNFVYFNSPLLIADNQTSVQQIFRLPNPLDTATSAIQCFIQLVHNFKITSTSQLGINCVTSFSDANNAKLQIGILLGQSGDGSTARRIWVSLVVLQQSTIISFTYAKLLSQYPNPATASLTIPSINAAYLVGICTIISMTRIFSFRLAIDTFQVDVTANYYAVRYNYMLITFDLSTLNVYIYQTQTNFQDNFITLRYRNVVNPASITKNQFSIIGTSSLAVEKIDYVEVIASPTSLGQVAVTFSYLASDISLSHQIKFLAKAYGVLFSIQTTIYLTRLKAISIEVNTNAALITINNVIGSTSQNSYVSNFTFYSAVNSFTITLIRTTFNATLMNNAYDKIISLKVVYPSEDFISNISFVLIKVQYVEATITTNQSKIKLSGFVNPSTLLSSQFIINGNQQIDSITIQDKSAILTFSNGIQNLLDKFQITYIMPITFNRFAWTSIQMHMVEIVETKQIDEMNQLNITIANPHNISVLAAQFKLLSPSFLSIDSLTAADNFVHLILNLSQNIKTQQQVSLEYQHPNLTYSHILNFQINVQKPIYFWSGNAAAIYGIQVRIGDAIQYIYLAVFAISMICNKLIGVETILMLHLAFYSFIPIGIEQSVSLIQWGLMKYVSGYNPLFSNQSSNYINSNYSSLNLKCTFQSNFNLMGAPLLIYPLIFLCLYLMARKNFHYQTKPRLLQYSMAFLLQFPLATLLFNSFNIFISFVMNLKCVGLSDLGSLVFSIIMLTLIPSTITLLTVFQKKFTEFNKQISEVDMIFRIHIEKSTQIRKVYPLVLGVQMILIPIFLSIESLFSINLYLVLVINVIVTIYIIIATPYIRKSDNFRLLFNRIIILSITATQLYTNIEIVKQILSQFISYQSWIIYALLIIGVILNSVFITMKTIEWFKKPGIIDMQLYVQQKGTTKKIQEIGFVYLGDGTSYPKLEYGVGRKNLIERRIGRFSKSLKKELLLNNSMPQT